MKKKNYNGLNINKRKENMLKKIIKLVRLCSCLGLFVLDTTSII